MTQSYRCKAEKDLRENEVVVATVSPSLEVRSLSKTPQVVNTKTRIKRLN